MKIDERGKSDKLILFTALLLSGIGAIMVYSASAIMSLEKFSDPYFYFKKQLLAIIIGTILMVCAMNFNYKKYYKLAIPSLMFAIVLLILVFIPGINETAKGATRWIAYKSLRFQPAEFMKFALILYAARYISKKGDKLSDFTKGILPLSIVFGIVAVLIMKQPDFGTVMIMAIVLLIMLFIGGMNLKYLFSLMAVITPMAIFAVLSEPYRMKRITAFLNPWEYPRDSGFQLIQSLYAFGRGGIFGVGFGESREKLFYLPEPHNDFILSVVGEEIGMLGVITIVGLFFIYVYRGFKVAMNVDDTFGAMLSAGIVSLIGIQGLINMAVALGLFPTKGITLPFISYGGSSMIFMMFLTGVLLNISENARR
ncbi:MAG: putative lipid II flippase FtsW [Candidatus Schekmanbacteria bacterium]|nr:MAG: putative lipid II flippase FtsW [Candidatus Schekmanbacteria bacterium]